MPHNPSTRLRELYKKIQDNTATPEELRQFIELTGEPDQQELLPFQEWEEAPIQPLPRQLSQRILRKATGKTRFRRLLPYAAAAAVVTLALRLFWPATPSTGDWVTVTSRDGEIKTFLLPDSSSVTLNARSTIRYSPAASAATRTVYLEGQAFFDVRPNQQRPFIVNSGRLSTQVLGTSFDVRSYPFEKPQIAVLTGRVKVNAPHHQSIILEPGQLAAYAADGNRLSRLTADTAYMSSWQQGIINMNNLTLREIGTVLERWYSIRVVLETPGIDTYVLSGTQANTSLTAALESICFVFHLQYRQEGNTVYIRKK